MEIIEKICKVLDFEVDEILDFADKIKWFNRIFIQKIVEEV